MHTGLIRSLLSKINLVALKSAAAQVGFPGLAALGDLPDPEAGQEALRAIHHAVFEIHVIDGALVCPQSGRRFPVKDGSLYE